MKKHETHDGIEIGGLPVRPKIYIETYGCQMNVNDSEVVISILKQNNGEVTDRIEDADIVLVNTCSIRENAEQKVRTRLFDFKKAKKKRPSMIVGVLGCMAERLKEELLENKIVDLVVGPDSYRLLPELLEDAARHQKAINTELSIEETYENIIPSRTDANGVSAFVSIMRGCNNFCTYCVVPYTRGRERSRDPETILNEVRNLLENGYREVSLLGQNVNSYSWGEGKSILNFPKLIRQVSLVDPQMRVRFSTSHPKDISNELLETIAEHKNICRSIHLPVQSGSNRILDLMSRKYSREWYLERIEAIHKIIPDCTITTDIISGFCSETKDDHEATLDLMKTVSFDLAYMFKYSERPGTLAAKKYKDDVPEEEKSERLNQIQKLQSKLSEKSCKSEIGKTREVLIEKTSKRSDSDFSGRTSQNKVVVFPKTKASIGDYVQVKIISANSATLIGKSIE